MPETTARMSLFAFCNSCGVLRSLNPASSISSKHIFWIPRPGIVDNSGPFGVFCNDLRLRTCFDFEFTNVMLAQFAYDLPWWLILQPPGIGVREGKQKFLDLFEPREEQFIYAMERVEGRSALPAGEPRLSARMRESWDSERFWFNLALKSSFDVDWEVLYKEGLGEAMLDTATLAGKEEFLKRKKDQFEAYWAESRMTRALIKAS
jgi:hypothetical protein